MKKILPVLTFLMLFALVVPVSAKEESESVMNSEEMRAQREERRLELEEKEQEREEMRLTRQEERDEKEQERNQERCDQVEQRLLQHRERYQNYTDTHVSRFQRIEEVVEALVARLDGSGIDLTAVVADLQTLEQMTNKLQTLSVAYADKMEAMDQYECGSAQDAYKAGIDEVRSSLEDVKAQRDEIREFVTSELRPSLLQLREQVSTQEQE